MEIVLTAAVSLLLAACPPPAFLSKMEGWIADGDLDRAVEVGEKRLEKCGDAEGTAALIGLLQRAWLERAEREDTIPAFVAVAERFPGSPAATEARAMEIELAWADARLGNDVAAYRAHRENYPDSPHAADAADLEARRAFAGVQQEPTVEALGGFRERYADHELAAEAFALEGELAYGLAVEAELAATWADYVRTYADHPRRPEAESAWGATAYRDARNAEGIDALLAFVDDFPADEHVLDARWDVVARAATLGLGGIGENRELSASDLSAGVSLPELPAGAELTLRFPIPMPDEFVAAVSLDLQVAVADGAPRPLEDLLAGGVVVRPDAGVPSPGLTELLATREHAADGLTLRLRQPLIHPAGIRGLVAAEGYALVLAPPEELEREPLVCPLSLPALDGEVEGGHDPGATVLYARADGLYLASATGSPPTRLAALPAGTKGWRLEAMDTRLTWWGEGGAGVVGLVTGQAVVDLGGDQAVREVRTCRGGWLVHLQRHRETPEGWKRTDHGLTLVPEGGGAREDLIGFEDGWTGALEANDRWLVFPLRDEASKTSPLHVIDLDDPGAPLSLEFEAATFALGPGRESELAYMLRYCDGSLLAITLPDARASHIWSLGGRRECCGMDVSWPEGAGGPVVGYQEICGWPYSYRLIPRQAGGWGAARDVSEAQVQAWNAAGASDVDVAPGTPDGYSLEQRSVRGVDELFSIEVGSGREAQVSRVAKYRSDRWCGNADAEKISGLRHEVVPNGEHVVMLAYRHGCDAAAGPLLIRRVDGGGEQVELGTDSGIPGWVFREWSTDGRYLLVGARRGSPQDLTVYGPEGTLEMLDSEVSHARWFEPTLPLLLSGVLR